MRRLWSDADVDNGASRRILESVGFGRPASTGPPSRAATAPGPTRSRYDLLGSEFTATD